MPGHALRLVLSFAVLAVVMSRPTPASASASASTSAPAPTRPESIERLREVLVPFEDLNVLLAEDTSRVLLSREQYETLLAEARRTPDARAPRTAAIIAASYEATLAEERAEITGRLVVDVLEPGLHAVDLDLSRVGIRRVQLDEQAAALGRGEDGRLRLFVAGEGRHELVLDLVAPLTTDSAVQQLTVRVPTPASTQFGVTVPGDVDIELGPAVIARAYDPATESTRIDLALERDRQLTLVMTLNSRLKREQRLVVARSVIVSELTQAYEKLHATFSMGVLHRAVDRFRFDVPPGFEITDVGSAQLAEWTVVDAADGSVLEVRLREPVGGTVVLSVSGVREEARVEGWRFPRLRPLDVVSEVAVVGVLVEDRLGVETVRAAGLMPIDTSVLTRALPAGVLAAGADAPTVRPVVAYYAPQSNFELEASVVKGPAQLRVTTNLLMTLDETQQEVRGGFTVLPLEERCFELDFSMPHGWQIIEVTGAGGEALRFERFTDEDDPDGAGPRIRVRLPHGIAVGTSQSVYFRARSVPEGWLDEWASVAVPFPVFAVIGATSDAGAIAVATRDDIDVRPVALDALLPLDEQDKQKFGLGNVVTRVAYRYDQPPYRADLVAERVPPRIIARTFSFFRLAPDQRTVHYEIIYDVEHARTRRLSLLLPETTPTALSITGRDGVALKGFTHEPAGDGMRRWTAVLTEARRGPLRLAVDFEQRVDHTTGTDMPLPVVRADGVAFQSGLLAVEGSSELEVEVAQHPRPIDVGELVDAEYEPGQRLVGAFGFVGDPPVLSIKSSRHPADAPPPAIVQQARLTTALAANGLSQTSAQFTLHTKALFLEIHLPADAELWTITVDGRPTKPQRDGERLVVDLATDAIGGAGAGSPLRELVIVYESPVSALHLLRSVAIPAPELRFLQQRGAAAEAVPVADLQWDVYVPHGYALLTSGGTVTFEELAAPRLAVSEVARWLYRIGGGMRGAIWKQVSATIGTRFDMGESAAQAPLMSPAAPPMAGAEIMADAAAADFEERAKEAAPAPMPRRKSEPEQEKKIERRADLLGVRSLNIDLDRSGRRYHFQSLGVDPQVSMTLASRRRLDFVAWAVALVIVLIGVARSDRPVSRRARFVFWIGLLATLAAIVIGRRDVTLVANAAFYAAAMLVPFWLVLGCLRWTASKTRAIVAKRRAVPAAAATAAVLLALLATPGVAFADTEDPDDDDAGPPITVPDDAVIVPYDPDAGTDDGAAGRLLVPYQMYVELWNRVHPDQPIVEKAPQVPFAMAGAAYSGELRAERSDPALTLSGHLEIDVFSDEPVHVPLAMRGAVIVSALVDGRPAKLSVVGGEAGRAASNHGQQGMAQQQVDEEAAPPDEPGLLLQISGRGRHALDLVVRVPLDQRGGWRVAQARVPTAPATSLTLTVPDAGTELRMAGVMDRRAHETAAPGETIRTAIAPGAELRVEWRPAVSRGLVDLSLKAESIAVLDVLEDGARLHWNVGLEFLRGQRDAFSIAIPTGYLVEKVDGKNVRGWEVTAGTGDAGRQTLDITLLKVAEDRERFAVHLRRPWPDGGAGADKLSVPVLDIAGASLHGGTLVVRRSPVLDVRTVETTGVTRTDLPKAIERTIGSGDAPGPMGIQSLAAYRFVTTPYVVRLAVAPVEMKVTARLQTILRIAERERSVESRVLLNVQRRSLFLVRLLVPGDLELDDVAAAGSAEWSEQMQDDGRKRLTVFMQTGQRGSVPIVIRGTLGARGLAETVALPVISVLDVPDQEGDVVVQVDPAFDVTARDLVNAESVLMSRVASWLQAGQRATARMVLHHRTADYGAVFDLAARQPDVSCDTVTNVRLTDQSIEDTVLLDFTIRRAGIRTVSFLLPEFMADARISVPLLQQRTVEPVAERAGWVRMRLDLQDDVMDRLRVLVESERLLTPGGDGHRAAIPRVETGSVQRRYVAMENAGRDELVVTGHAGLDPLTRQQREWQAIAAILPGGLTEAYLARSDDADPSLVFRTKQRQAVETAGARIGLAQTMLVLDANGAYRASQVYRVDNSTEQFLEIELPEGADQWAVRVGGEPVKPARLADPTKPRHVRIPLVKTALGELDYEVMIKYGGATDPIGRLSTVNVPLIRTVNISVELSQVRLLVPETHAWFDFGGTMRRVTEAGDFEAGYLSYQTKNVQRLAQTMRDANVYAQLRAAQNIEDLSEEIEGFQNQIDVFRGNPELRKQQTAQTLALKSAQTEMQRLEETPVLAEVEDNRARLNAVFGSQLNLRSKNVVQDLAGNFPVATDAPSKPDEAAPGEGDRFSDKWITANQLGSKEEVAGKGGGSRVAASKTRAPVRSDDFAMYGQPKAPEVAQRDEIDELNAAFGADEDAVELKDQLTDESVGKAGRYQRRLAERGQRAAPQSGLPSVDRGLADAGAADRQAYERAGDDQVARGLVLGRGMGGGGGGFGGGRAAGQAAGLGLVSLDVELPQRGVEYRFTTPRGDIEITARAASRTTLVTMKRLGILVAVLAGLLVLRRIARRFRAIGVTLLDKTIVGAAMTLVGIVGLVLGVLPVAAMVVIVAGIVVMVRARRAQFVAPAAA